MKNNHPKEKFKTSVELLFNKVEDRIKQDISISKFSPLYDNKIIDQESVEAQEFLTKLTDGVNDILNQHKKACLNSIERTLDNFIIANDVLGNQNK